MAGDWIKMRVSLSTHPKVLEMAEFLHNHGPYVEWQAPASAIGGPSFGPDDQAEHEALVYAALRVTRYVTVAALLRFWGYANEHADADFIRGLRLNDVDEITGIPGFGAAMAHVSWAEHDPSGGGVRLPNFSEFNSVAKVRSNAAERQRRYRERHADGHGNARSNALRNEDVTGQRREEKRKEKEPAAAPPPRAECSESFLTAWAEYPKRSGDNPKAAALRAWSARIGAGRTPAEMIAGVKRYAVWCRVTNKTGTETVMQAKRFFGPDEPFLNTWEVGAAPPKPVIPDCNVPGCKREGMPGLGGKCEAHYESPRRAYA